MKVEALLCDHAQVHAGKLFISGAAVNLLGTPTPQPPHPVGIWIAIMITIPWQATNQMHNLLMVVEDQDGQRVQLTEPPPGAVIAEEDRGGIIAQFNVGRAPMMQVGEDSLLPIALPIATPLPHLGPFSIVLSIDGTEMTRLSFRLMPMSAGQPLPMGPSAIPPIPAS